MSKVELTLYISLLSLFYLQYNVFSDGKLYRNDDNTKIYVLHFPQFHEDPLNNELWGKGFSDWNSLNNSRRMNKLRRPLIHPHQSIGYYDQASFATRRKQGELAKEYKVDGFIYHHYWFYQTNRERNATLGRPIENMLEDHEPNVSFAFNFAFESWKGTWQGPVKNRSASMPVQLCPEKTDQRINDHYQYLRKFFHHPNYIKIHGVPLFMFLRSTWKNQSLCLHVLDRLKELAVEDGFPRPGLYVLGGHHDMTQHELFTNTPSTIHEEYFPAEYYYPYAHAMKNHHQVSMPTRCFHSDYLNSRYTRPQYVSSVVRFDNTPRRSFRNSIVWDRMFTAMEPGRSFERDLVTMQMYEKCCQHQEIREQGGKFIVINAWNEWGEGMALEPSVQYGFQFLQAVKASKRLVAEMQCDWQSYLQYISMAQAKYITTYK